jgi:hypothetical protein
MAAEAFFSVHRLLVDQPAEFYPGPRFGVFAVLRQQEAVHLECPVGDLVAQFLHETHVIQRRPWPDYNGRAQYSIIPCLRHQFGALTL